MSKFGNAQRKFPVAVRTGFVIEHAPWAVHRFDRKFTIFRNLRSEHVFPVMFPMTRSDPKLFCHELGRFNDLVPFFQMGVAPKLNEAIPNSHSIRMKKRHGWSFFFKRKEVELCANDTVIPFFGFFEHEEVLFEFFSIGERNSVNAREHFFVAIATPVSS